TTTAPCRGSSFATAAGGRSARSTRSPISRFRRGRPDESRDRCRVRLGPRAGGAVTDPGDELLVLHGLAVKKAGTANAVADILGEEPARVAAALQASVESGRAVEARGMFMATPAGRDWLAERYPAAFERFRTAPEATEAYERFERINRE